ncbi:MAG: hypothetical protein QXP02_00230 [Desulfurococcaceae archaeon]
MSRVVKVVVVTADHHPYHKLWLELAKRLGEKVNTPVEVKMEDYVYLVEHGDKDEFGMTWLPQILVETDDGKVYWLLSQLPLNDRLQPDEERALEIMINKLKELSIEF